VKKFEEMSRAFSIALNNGSGVLDQTTIVKIGDDNGKKRKEEGSKEDKKSSEEKALEALMKKEQEDLQELKKQIDTYIKNNGLTSDLETKLNMSQLMITISDNALFAPAQATVKPES